MLTYSARPDLKIITCTTSEPPYLHSQVDSPHVVRSMNLRLTY